MPKFKLSDGRTIHYEDHCSKNKRAMIFFHGVPSDHTAIESLPGFPFLAGFRLITLDRPGYGNSTPSPKMGYSCFAKDIEELINHLGLDDIYFEGVSGGAPWALGTAAQLGLRVKGLILVSPMGPLTDKVFNQVSKVNQRVYKISKKFPLLMRVNVAGISLMLRYFPKLYLKMSKAKMSKADIRDIENKNTKDILFKIFRRSTQKTSFGMYQDVVNQANEYDFELSKVNCPVIVFQGKDDLSTPPAVGEHYKECLEKCKLHVIPNAGHLWHFQHMKEILERGVEEIDSWGL